MKTAKATADSLKKVQAKVKQDSIAAVKTDKAKQDSIAAVKVAPKAEAKKDTATAAPVKK